MNRCYGTVLTKESPRYGEQCLIKTDDTYCEYHKWQRNDKKIVSQVVKKYLDQCENAKGRENKKAICEILFDYLSKNIGFINNYEKFSKAVFLKLTELEEDWERALYWKNIIFPHLVCQPVAFPSLE